MSQTFGPMKRRGFLRVSSSLTGAVLLAPSLQGLAACAVAPDGGRRMRRPEVAGRGAGGYGLLRTAGPELALPAGFTYSVLSYNGKPMSDGNETPGAFDGMAAFALPNGNVRLIRNHENRNAAATARVKGDPAGAYDSKAGGGTTSLEVQIDASGAVTVVRDFVSLNGTIVNCAGGPSPWGTWLTCEESTEGVAAGWGQEHGYVFEVAASAERLVTPVPLKAMGRFIHEAVAVDPDTGVVYETEDQQLAGFYRFIPREKGVLTSGGALQMLAIDGKPNYDTADGQRMGSTLSVTWVDIDDPDPRGAWGDTGAVFAQGFTKGGARFSRLEGCWWGDGGVFFHATNGGRAIPSRAYSRRTDLRFREEPPQPHRVRRSVFQSGRTNSFRQHHGLDTGCRNRAGDDARYSRPVGRRRTLAPAVVPRTAGPPLPPQCWIAQ